MLSRCYWILTLVYCLGIFVLSSGPVPIESPAFPGKDKIAHAVIYGGLAALLGAGLRQKGKASPAFQTIFPIIFATLYGLTDEIHQSFVPTRNCDMLDLLADFVGAAGFQVFFYAFWRRPRRSGIVGPQ